MSPFREDYSTYKELKPFGKCVVDGYVASAPEVLQLLAKAARMEAIEEASLQSMSTKRDVKEINKERDKKLAQADKGAHAFMRDVLLAVGGIENIIATLREPWHPQHHVLRDCVEKNPEIIYTPASPSSKTTASR